MSGEGCPPKRTARRRAVSCRFRASAGRPKFLRKSRLRTIFLLYGAVRRALWPCPSVANRSAQSPEPQGCARARSSAVRHQAAPHDQVTGRGRHRCPRSPAPAWRPRAYRRVR
jgi:hypothetical protein